MEKSRSEIPRSQPEKKKINRWKVAFLVLLAVVLGSGAFLGSRLFADREINYQKTPEIVERDGEPVLSVNTNKKQVNQLIDFYLDDFQKGQDIKYDFALENEAMLSGEFSVLGFPMKFYLYFDPYVMENGNVQLRAKSMSVGTFGLPMEEVMRIAKRSFKFPEWIEVDPDEKMIMIRLDQFRLQNGLFIRANKINLVDDEIQASLYLPKAAGDDQKTTDSSGTTKNSSKE